MTAQYQSKTAREDYDDGCADEAMSVGYRKGYQDALQELLEGLERGSVVHPCAYIRGRLNLPFEEEAYHDEKEKDDTGSD